jgi:hypothetical protein
MSLMDERVNVISHGSILGQSMSRINVKLHDQLAQQMAEFERNNKINVYPMGATAEHQTINAKADAIKQSLAKGSKAGGAHNKLRSKLKGAK